MESIQVTENISSIIDKTIIVSSKENDIKHCIIPFKFTLSDKNKENIKKDYIDIHTHLINVYLDNLEENQSGYFLPAMFDSKEL